MQGRIVLSSFSPLVMSFGEQERKFALAFSILREAIAARAFPGASVAMTYRGAVVGLKAFGGFVYEGSEIPTSPNLGEKWGTQSGVCGEEIQVPIPIGANTFFDLASVTKAVATTTMAAVLYERGVLELEAPVLGAVPEFLADSCGEVDPRRREVTFRMLLTHSSGLPAYEKLFLNAQSREELLRAAFTTSLFSRSGIASGVQRYWLHSSWRCIGAHGGRGSRSILSAGYFRATGDDSYNIQPAG